MFKRKQKKLSQKEKKTLSEIKEKLEQYLKVCGDTNSICEERKVDSDWKYGLLKSMIVVQNYPGSHIKYLEENNDFLRKNGYGNQKLDKLIQLGFTSRVFKNNSSQKLRASAALSEFITLAFSKKYYSPAVMLCLVYFDRRYDVNSLAEKYFKQSSSDLMGSDTNSTNGFISQVKENSFFSPPQPKKQPESSEDFKITYGDMVKLILRLAYQRQVEASEVSDDNQCGFIGEHITGNIERGKVAISPIPAILKIIESEEARTLDNKN